MSQSGYSSNSAGQSFLTITPDSTVQKHLLRLEIILDLRKTTPTAFHLLRNRLIASSPQTRIKSRHLGIRFAWFPGRKYIHVNYGINYPSTSYPNCFHQQQHNPHQPNNLLETFDLNSPWPSLKPHWLTPSISTHGWFSILLVGNGSAMNLNIPSSE